RERVSESLPEYMVPSSFVQLQEMPLTPNGKIDRKALPEPDRASDSGRDYAAPRSELEWLMAGIWQDVLGVEKVGIQDDFFELGGDSIKAIQVSTRMYRHHYKLEMKDLFQHPVIEQLIAYVQAGSRLISQEEVVGEL